MKPSLQTYTFLLTYKITDRNRVVLKSGQMRCKNQPDEESAKRAMEEALKKQNPHAHKVEFIGKCVNETLEQQGNDAIALIKRNKANLKKQ